MKEIYKGICDTINFTQHESTRFDKQKFEKNIGRLCIFCRNSQTSLQRVVWFLCAELTDIH